MAKLKWKLESGRLGGEPEISYLKDNKCMAKLSIAHNRYKWDDEEQEYEQIGITTWLNCAAFGYPAELIEAMELDKGDKIFAEGIMYLNEYEVEEDGEIFIEEGMNYVIDRIFRIPATFEDEEEDDRSNGRRRKKRRKKKRSKKRGRKSKSNGRKAPKGRLKKGKSRGKKKSKRNKMASKIAAQLGNK